MRIYAIKQTFYEGKNILTRKQNTTSANSGVGRQVKDLFGKYNHPLSLVPIRIMCRNGSKMGGDHNII